MIERHCSVKSQRTSIVILDLVRIQCSVSVRSGPVVSLLDCQSCGRSSDPHQYERLSSRFDLRIIVYSTVITLRLWLHYNRDYIDRVGLHCKWEDQMARKMNDHSNSYANQVLGQFVACKAIRRGQ